MSPRERGVASGCCVPPPTLWCVWAKPASAIALRGASCVLFVHHASCMVLPNGTKCGTRQLPIESSQEKLVEYFAAKGTPAHQLPYPWTFRRLMFLMSSLMTLNSEEMSSFVDEWKELVWTMVYAKVAGIDDGGGRQ